MKALKVVGTIGRFALAGALILCRSISENRTPSNRAAVFWADPLLVC